MRILAFTGIIQKKWRKLLKLNLLFSLLIIGSGCSTTPRHNQPVPGDIEYAPISTQALQPPRRINGSIYQENYGLSLYGDRKAHRVGDLITILLNERTVSKKSSQTSASKDDTNEFDPPIFLGMNPSAGDVNLEMDVDHSRSFSGQGKSDRSNSLQGNITVSVAEVLPNGLLRVQGEKWMMLNEGDEFIRIQGLIRPEDVSPENTVSSQKLADSRISFGGIGALANANKQGWLSRFFMSKAWPF